MKHYTTIEQSKKLVELGLNPETADMFWQSNLNSSDRQYLLSIGEEEYFDIELNPEYCSIGDYDIPAWSLGALLEVMPPYLFEFERGIDLNIYRNLNGKGWHVSYMPNNVESMQKDKFKQITNGRTPIEAAYNMVVWLLENRYIEKEK